MHSYRLARLFLQPISATIATWRSKSFCNGVKLTVFSASLHFHTSLGCSSSTFGVLHYPQVSHAPLPLEWQPSQAVVMRTLLTKQRCKHRCQVPPISAQTCAPHRRWGRSFVTGGVQPSTLAVFPHSCCLGSHAQHGGMCAIVTLAPKIFGPRRCTLHKIPHVHSRGEGHGRRSTLHT